MIVWLLPSPWMSTQSFTPLTSRKPSGIGTVVFQELADRRDPQLVLFLLRGVPGVLEHRHLTDGQQRVHLLAGFQRADPAVRRDRDERGDLERRQLLPHTVVRLVD